MPIITQYPSSNTVVTTGWSNPTRAYVADGSNLATAVPGQNLTINSDFSGFGFDAALPANIVINSVTVELYWKCSTTSSIATLRSQAYVSGAAQGSEYTTAAEPTSLTLNSYAVAGLTRTNLLDANFKVRVGATRGNTATSYTASMDYVRVKVDYTIPDVTINIPVAKGTIQGITPSNDVGDKSIQVSSLANSNNTWISSNFYSNTLFMGSYNSSYEDAAVTFPLNIPKNTIIKSATIRLSQASCLNSGNPTVQIKVEQVDSAVAPISQSDALGRTLSTDYVTFIPTWSQNTAVDTTPNIAALIQQIVDRAGYVQGNNIGIYFKSITPTTSDNEIGYYDISDTYDNRKPMLQIVYAYSQPSSHIIVEKQDGSDLDVLPEVTYSVTGQSDTVKTARVMTVPYNVLARSNVSLKGNTITNLLGSNGNLGDVTGYWYVSNGTDTVDTTNYVIGSKSVAVAATTTYFGLTSSTLNLDISKYYFISGFVKNVNDQYGASLILYDTSFSLLTEYITNIPNNKWVRIGARVQPSDFKGITSQKLSFVSWGNVTSGDTSYYDGVMITEIPAADYALSVSDLLEKYPYMDNSKSVTPYRLRFTGNNLFNPLTVPINLSTNAVKSTLSNPKKNLFNINGNITTNLSSETSTYNNYLTGGYLQTANGTWSTNTQGQLIDVINGATYTVSAKSKLCGDGAITRLRVCDYTNSNEVNAVEFSDINFTQHSFTFTAPSNKIALTFGRVYANNDTNNPAMFYDIQIENGSSATAYEQYQLIDGLKLKNTVADINLSCDYKIKLRPNTSYTLSMIKNMISGTSGGIIGIYSDDPLAANALIMNMAYASNTAIFTTQSTGNIILKFFLTTGTSETAEIDFTSIQLEEGRLTSYMPYQETTVNLNNPLAAGQTQSINFQGVISLSGSSNLALDNSYVGFKSIKYPVVSGALNQNDYDFKLIKSDMTTFLDNRLIDMSTSFTAKDQALQVVRDGSFLFTVGNSDAGWMDSYIPSQAEINAYFYGWKMCNSDNTSPYLKNEVPYDPTTWSQWVKNSSVGDSTGLEITAINGTYVYNYISTSFKPNTKYGFLLNVVSSNLTTQPYISSGDAFGAFYLGTSAGNNKAVSTSLSSIASNYIHYTIDSGEVSGNKIKIKDLRVFELPVGSQIEADFTNLTADQLAAKYGFYGIGTKYWNKISDGSGLTSTLPTTQVIAGYELDYQLASPTITGGSATISAPTAAASAVFNSPTIYNQYSLSVSTATGKAAGGAIVPTLSLDVVMKPPVANANAQGRVPVIGTNAVMSIAAATATASGSAVAPTVALVRNIVAPTAVANSTGNAVVPSISTSISVSINAPTAKATGAGLSPTVSIVVVTLINPNVVNITGKFNAPVISTSVNVTTAVVNATSNSVAPVISTTKNISINVPTIVSNAAANNITLKLDSIISIPSGSSAGYARNPLIDVQKTVTINSVAASAAARGIASSLSTDISISVAYAKTFARANNVTVVAIFNALKKYMVSVEMIDVYGDIHTNVVTKNDRNIDIETMYENALNIKDKETNNLKF